MSRRIRQWTRRGRPSADQIALWPTCTHCQAPLAEVAGRLTCPRPHCPGRSEAEPASREEERT